MYFNSEQIAQAFIQAGFRCVSQTKSKELWKIQESESIYINLKAKLGVSAIILSPEWFTRQEELQSIPGIVPNNKPYHSSNLKKFPKRLHTGKNPINYGMSITVENERGLQSLVKLLTSTQQPSILLASTSSAKDTSPHETLTTSHSNLLAWFEQFTGQLLTWEQLQEAPATVTISAKGIYKPSTTRYALSIRQTLDSPYGDQEPEYQDDGGWRYRYAQEENKKGSSSALFTNQGLKHCMDDGVPVAVLRQISKKPQVTRYQILGLAYVTAWKDGFFTLQSTTLSDQQLAAGTRLIEQPAGFDPQYSQDNRKRTFREITTRQGQPKFRSGLLTAYYGRCAVTGCALNEVLEAAHITPYLGPQTNHISNGLVLRSDLHILWDRGLIYLNNDYTLQLKPKLFTTEYETFAGRKISLPHQTELRPSLAAIQAHKAWALIES